MKTLPEEWTKKIPTRRHNRRVKLGKKRSGSAAPQEPSKKKKNVDDV